MSRLWYRLTGDRQGQLRREQAWMDVPSEIKDAKRIKGLQHAQDFIDAIALLVPDAIDCEVYLRRRLWWLSKNHQRLRTDGTLVSSSPEVSDQMASANMYRLLELFEHDPKAQVARGELLRQLGRFDEAVAVLRAVKPDGHSEVQAVKIQRFAEAQNAELQAF